MKPVYRIILAVIGAIVIYYFVDRGCRSSLRDEAEESLRLKQDTISFLYGVVSQRESQLAELRKQDSINSAQLWKQDSLLSIKARVIFRPVIKQIKTSAEADSFLRAIVAEGDNE